METFDEFKKQCGEIYLLSSGAMTFHCTMCEEKYNGFDDFAIHVNLTHKQTDYTMIKEEISEDIEEHSELNMCSVTMGSGDELEESILPMPMETAMDSSNDEDDDKMLHNLHKEACYSSGGELTFEVALVDENVDADDVSRGSLQKKQKQTLRNLTVKKEGNPKKIVPRRPRNSGETNSKQNPYACTECDYSTNLKVKLVEHMRRHFNDRPFSCDYCEQRFYMQNEKTRHTARQHPETVEPKQPSPEKLALKVRIKSSLMSLGDNKFQCKECNFTCEGRASMWYHIRRHSTYKPYQCSFKGCSKSFYTTNELNTHVRSHTGEKPFLCTECGSAFSTSSKLTTHLKRHNNIRDKECPTCQRRFFNKVQLENHMAVHSDERPFVCEMCPSTFKRKKTLSSHMKVHVNGRAYQCDICDAGFSQQAGLLMHIRAKHTLAVPTYTADSVN